MKYAICYIYGLSVVLALALSGTFLGLESALADSVIATIRIGYADGYPRSLSNGVGKVLIRNKLFPVVGSVCMDMTMIDVTDLPEIKEGDEVIVFGRGLTLNTLAEWAGTIPYDIMTGISQRVKRVYFED